MNEYEILTDTKFKEIYSNEKFRNEVAHAHQCCDAHSKFLHWGTFSYPIRYMVTKEQINEATRELQRAKVITKKNNKVKLILIGMGSVYEAKYEDDVCNHRVRGFFKNAAHNLFFIEFRRGIGKDDFCIDHANDETKAIELNKQHDLQSEYYNYKGLERLGSKLGKYTKSNLLSIVNKYFDCNFQELVVDNYTLSPDDVVSISPKQ